jgi:hypothetical protein
MNFIHVSITEYASTGWRRIKAAMFQQALPVIRTYQTIRYPMARCHDTGSAGDHHTIAIPNPSRVTHAVGATPLKRVTATGTTALQGIC